jgi:calcium-dependent protein kinase
MIDQIMRGAISFEAPVWNIITDDAKDFVKKLLVVDPRKRMDAYMAIHHNWIVNRENHPEDTPPEDVLLAIDDSLLNYRQTSKLKKLALTLIAHRSTSKDIIELRKVFDSFDTEKNGVLSYDEFKSALEKMGFSEDEMSTIFSSIVSWKAFSIPVQSGSRSYCLTKHVFSLIRI